MAQVLDYFTILLSSEHLYEKLARSKLISLVREASKKQVDLTPTLITSMHTVWWHLIYRLADSTTAKCKAYITIQYVQ